MNFSSYTSENVTESGIILGLDPKVEQQATLKLMLQDAGFINAIKEHVSGIKPNLKFYQDSTSIDLLKKILAQFEGTHRILDAKLSDGFHTENNVINQYSGIIDGITLAPASGDDISYIEELKKRKIDSYSMGAMSFPGVINDLLIAGDYQFKLNKIKQNIEAGVNGLVMGATAFITDIDDEVKKLREKVNSGNKEYLCLKNYNDDDLARGIHLRNELFTEIYKTIGESNNTPHILSPGFGRQGGKMGSFLAGNQYGGDIPHLLNAGSDIFKGTEEMNIHEARDIVLVRLNEFNLTIMDQFKEKSKK